MGDEYPTVTVAAVQAAPVFLDREETVDKATDLIAQASSSGAEVVAFPEGFVPGHPLWFHFHPATSDVASRLSTELFKNAVEVPGPTTRKLAEAAEQAGVYLTMGVCEKEPDTTGTMYNSQLFFSPDGELIGKHQKLRPTVGEQLVHTQAEKGTLGTVETEFGPMSGLICGENSNPLAIFALTAEYTRIHTMSWPPYISSKSNPLPQRVLDDSKGFAQMSKAYVVSAVGTVDERMIDKLHLDESEAESMRNSRYSGGSVIVAPSREIVAGPLDNEEDILLGEIDLETGVSQKLRHDFAGHYNRPDIFQLSVDQESRDIYDKSGEGAGTPIEGSAVASELPTSDGDERESHHGTGESADVAQSEERADDPAPGE